MTVKSVERLVGRELPPVRLPSTKGGEMGPAGLRETWMASYTYPQNMVDMPGVMIPEGWKGTPGLSGCTAEACAFRDAHGEMVELEARIFGVSVQETAYQREFIRRFHLPFPLLSDAKLELARALGLPTVGFAGETLLRRLTLIADPQGVVRKVYDTIPAPGGHALEVLAYLWSVRGGAT